MSMFGRRKIKKAAEKEFLISKEAPFAVEEAYKSLRTNLIFSLPEENCKIIEVTSSLQKEGKSITAANLAISLSKNGSRVILVDCDLRLPTIARKLRIEQKPGLTNLLFGMNKMHEVINHHVSGIDVIPAGDLPPNPSEVLGSQNMKTAIDHLAQHYDYVILDTPPVNVVSDAVILSKHASGVIMVVRSGKTALENVKDAVDTLKLANANILGFVMTDADEKKQYYDKYGYTYKQKKG
ncbi:MAG: CpsD/CapB family tyrosine-protein kinase [Oscillospiraceae bacterium]|nr:CpsD/CapB family tyrosine-protein kinase [Oscillospiraceae bacterium]